MLAVRVPEQELHPIARAALVWQMNAAWIERPCRRHAPVVLTELCAS